MPRNVAHRKLWKLVWQSISHRCDCYASALGENIDLWPQKRLTCTQIQPLLSRKKQTEIIVRS